MMAKHREDHEIARKQPPKEIAGDGEGRWVNVGFIGESRDEW